MRLHEEALKAAVKLLVAEENWREAKKALDRLNLMIMERKYKEEARRRLMVRRD